MGVRLEQFERITKIAPTALSLYTLISFMIVATLVVPFVWAQSSSQVALIVDSSDSQHFSLFRNGVEKYLLRWKFNYDFIDVSTTELSETLLAAYNLIVVAQFRVFSHVSGAELESVESAVLSGVGLIHLDADLLGCDAIWSGYKAMLGVGLHNWIETGYKFNLTIVDSSHFISRIYNNSSRLAVRHSDWSSGDIESDLIFQNEFLK